MPGYSKKITEPMDLSTARSKIQSFRYTSVQGLHQDLCRMFDNCALFNGPEKGITIVRSMCVCMLHIATSLVVYGMVCCI